MRSFVFVVSICCIGCNAVVPRIGAVPPLRPGLPDRGATRDTIPNPPLPRTVRDPAPELRYQCRSENPPSGWVITSYQISSECPTQTDTEYNRAVLRSLQPYRVNDTLDVCADQPVPRGWLRDGAPETGCPGARVETDSPTMMRIRRRE